MTGTKYAATKKVLVEEPSMGSYTKWQTPAFKINQIAEKQTIQVYTCQQKSYTSQSAFRTF